MAARANEIIRKLINEPLELDTLGKKTPARVPLLLKVRRNYKCRVLKAGKKL